MSRVGQSTAIRCVCVLFNCYLPREPMCFTSSPRWQCTWRRVDSLKNFPPHWINMEIDWGETLRVHFHCRPMAPSVGMDSGGF